MTSAPPAELRSLIETHIEGFNTQNNDLFVSVFGDTAIIVDGIAPYRWLNPNAPAKWLADADKWRRGLGVTNEHLSYEMGFWNVEGSSAYARIRSPASERIPACRARIRRRFSQGGRGRRSLTSVQRLIDSQV
jgi:hypothetical protein